MTIRFAICHGLPPACERGGLFDQELQMPTGRFHFSLDRA